MEGRDRPIDRLAKNILLFGEQDEGEEDVRRPPRARCATLLYVQMRGASACAVATRAIGVPLPLL